MTEEFDTAMHTLIKASSVKLNDDIQKLVEKHKMDIYKMLLVSPCMASYTVRLKAKIVVYHDGLEIPSRNLAEYINGSLDAEKEAEERGRAFKKKYEHLARPA